MTMVWAIGRTKEPEPEEANYEMLGEVFKTHRQAVQWLVDKFQLDQRPVDGYEAPDGYIYIIAEMEFNEITVH